MSGDIQELLTVLVERAIAVVLLLIPFGCVAAGFWAAMPQRRRSMR